MHKDSMVVAPFGVATKRFCNIGFHPGLDPTGSLRKQGGVGPGHYNLPKHTCSYKLHYAKDSWSRKKELEEFSKMLGFRNAEILKNRREACKANGPGTRDIAESYYKPISHNIKQDVTFGKQNRFYNSIKNDSPGPGSYGKNHEPQLRYEETQLPKHQWTYLPTFEWDGYIDRFRIGRLTKPWSLPPNRYDVKHTVGISATLSKRVSKRGPYDCFTGPRDDSTIKGYFASSSVKGAKIWPRSLPNEMDKLKHRSKARYGCFLKSDRFSRKGIRNALTSLVMCPKNPTDPGPGHYNVSELKNAQQNIYPFNSSVLYARPIKKWELLPGIGRYNEATPKCKYKTNSESWPFKSKTKREFYKITTYNSF